MRSVLWIVVVGSLSLTACGDGGNRGAGGADAGPGGGGGQDATMPMNGGFGGLPAERPIESLNEGEANAFCRDALEHTYQQIPRDEFQRFLCTVGGAFSASTAEECEESVSTCLEEPASDQECDFDAESRRGCAITVGEYERCYRDMMAVLDSVTPQVTCELAGDPGALQSTLNREPPASCAAVRERCPGLFGSNEE